MNKNVLNYNRDFGRNRGKNRVKISDVKNMYNNHNDNKIGKEKLLKKIKDAEYSRKEPE